MIKKINHIGIAVKNLNNSNELFSKLFDKKPFGNEIVESEKVEVSFFKIGESNIELLSATDNLSTVSKFITKRGEGINHICLEVDDIEKEIFRLTNLGFEFINKTPIIGSHNSKIVFIHPKSANGVLIELNEKMDK